MNNKTIKLLKKYSLLRNEDIKKIKKWWLSLSWKEKARERIRIQKELAD